MKFFRIAFLLAFPIYLASCSNQKKLPPYYLDRIYDTTKRAYQVPELKIQKDDQLSIRVYSTATTAAADMLYNLPDPPAGSSGQNQSGFLVDYNGNIEYPRLGTIHVEGLTKQELAAEIRKRLTQPIELLNNPTVIIRFLNFKVNVMGFVGKEGLVSVPGEKLTILEAIGLAGGITEFGKKDKVQVVRETNGTRETGIIDLTSDSLFKSPYYYLVQNDLLIVEPTKQKARSQDQAQVAQRISLGIGIITAAAFIYNIFK